jgi:hypothetical protein
MPTPCECQVLASLAVIFTILFMSQGTDTRTKVESFVSMGRRGRKFLGSTCSDYEFDGIIESIMYIRGDIKLLAYSRV